METLSKEKLITDLHFYKNKLRDVVTAYKSLQKEKEALEIGLKAIKNVSEVENTEQKYSDTEKAVASSSKDEQNFSSEVTMLMNSLTALSAEKSRMESNFQADKKKLRQEKEKCDITIHELKDKIKSINLEHSKEVEQLKTNLIIERHEREKEQNDFQIQIRELQDILQQERDSKIFLEKTLSEISLRDETERYMDVERSEKMITLQQAQFNALETEKQMIQKEAQRAYEQRIASLESKLSELSSTLARYNRSRQEDQNEISKLREKLSDLTALASTKSVCFEDAECQTNLLGMDKIDDNICSSIKNVDKLLNEEKYLENQNKDDFVVPSIAKDKQERDSNSNILENELKNLKIKLQMVTDLNSSLNDQYSDTVSRYENQLDEVRKQHGMMISRYEKDQHDLHSHYKSQMSELENQVQKQRERTIALLEEKEQEITTLKTSFQLFVPGNRLGATPEFNGESLQLSQLDEVLGGMPRINTQENPHILYYAHELARRDVVITGLRKNCCQLENTLRDMKKEFIMLKQNHLEQVNNLNTQINRLERCQSREGANLEYLKNVIVNYLQSKNSSSKRHMLNAIALILKLTDGEINTIKNAL